MAKPRDAERIVTPADDRTVVVSFKGKEIHWWRTRRVELPNGIRKGRMTLEFDTVDLGWRPLTPADALAAAVLTGDAQAALLLADLVQEQWASR